MPRLAPVTSASLPASCFESVMEPRLAAGDQRKRGRAFLLGEVGQRRRISPGEASVAALRLRVVPFLAERPIETFDRDEGEAVRVDVVGHASDAHLRGEKL